MSSLGLQATGAALQALDAQVPTLVEDRVATRLAAQDPTLWGPAAQQEASQRLGWMDPLPAARDLVPRITALRQELEQEGVGRVVLAGMGGSSLAPEVIAAASGVPLTVLDSTDPEMVGNVLAEDIRATVLVVSSKSGSTVETDSQRRVFEQAFTDAGLDAASRIVVVTDPGSPLQDTATQAGYRAVFTADLHVGGRYSALTAFGLVPCGLAGVDLESLLDEAEEAFEILAEDDQDNLGLQLGAVLGGTSPLRDKLVLSDHGSGLPGFGDWAEQLIAESTGKEGTGLLPVVVQDGAPETRSTAADLLQIRLVPVPGAATDLSLAEDEDEALTEVPDSETLGGDAVEVFGSLGGQFVLWEFATAVAGRLLGINPFDQPDVESAKAATRGLLETTSRPVPPAHEVEGIGVDGPEEIVAAPSLSEVLRRTVAAVPEGGYLAVQAYLDRLGQEGLSELREDLARAGDRPVTFGWGPRFLHSTGQFHKGGPARGVFLQITADSDTDLEIPGREFTFGTLIAAQADGDASVLREHGLTVVRLHLQDRSSDVGTLLSAAREA